MSQLFAVNEFRQANDCLDLFNARYRKRYGTTPIHQNVSYVTKELETLSRNPGAVKTKKLINLFFDSDGDNGWFKRRNHEFPCFVKNIEQLNAMLAKTEQKYEQAQSTRGLMIVINTGCKNPNCNNRVDVTCDSKRIESAAYSQYCKEHNEARLCLPSA